MRVHAKVHAETQKPRNRAAFSNAFFPLIAWLDSRAAVIIVGVGSIGTSL